MEKIPCKECGSLILPTTAESTGGVCMACKQGIRKSMEASRAYYESLKNCDPFRELWKSLVERSSLDRSLGNLSNAERIYFAVTLLEGEVYNGGFDQFFSNSSGDYFHLVLDGLKELGAESSQRLLKNAAEIIFGNDDPPIDRAERGQIMASKAHRLSEIVKRHRQASQLERLDKQFCGDPDQLGERLSAYAKVQGLIDPFLENPQSA